LEKNMARVLSEKTRILRQALKDYPSMGNTELANKLNGSHPGHDFKPSDVGNQKQVLKKAAERPTGADADFDDEEADTARGRRPSPRVSLSRPGPGKPAGGLTPEDVGALRGLVHKAGGIEELIRWLELLRDFES
jgi:hypothetical protein